MLIGAWVSKEVDILEDSLAAGRLSMESRSILKSIQTEESKLVQSSHLTRSDRHYFRARFNYYRLSLLRLPADERELLEPVLNRFLARINSLENGGSDSQPTPFLVAVEKPAIEKPNFPIEVMARESEPRPVVEDSSLKEILSQLSLVRLALSSELSANNREILAEGIDRIIVKLKK